MDNLISGEVKEVVVNTQDPSTGEPADPSSVRLYVFLPDGTREQYPMTKTSTGKYAATVDFTSEESGEGYLVVESVSTPFVDKIKTTFELERLRDEDVS